MAVMIQYVFRANPGKSFEALVENAKQAAGLWRRHGASPSLWAVSVGEIGNLAFVVRFESYAEYGKCYDALLADQEFRAWQVKSHDSGLGEWVRANVAREIPL